jgi:hypothetical protein
MKVGCQGGRDEVSGFEFHAPMDFAEIRIHPEAQRSQNLFVIPSARSVLISVIVCAACANFSMRQRRDGGFQTRPFSSRFFIAPFGFFAAILLFGRGFAALGLRREMILG